MTTIMTTIRQQEEECEKKFMTKLSYYRIALSTVLASLGIIVAIVMTIIGASYGPVKDIATMKVQITEIHEKVDLIIKNSHIKPEAKKTEVNLVNNRIIKSEN